MNIKIYHINQCKGLDENNLILSGDSYKCSHGKMYEPGILEMYNYLESRGGVYGDTTMFGAQALLSKYLLGSVISTEDISEAEEICNYHFGRTDVFNKEAWNHIRKDHVGKLPLEICCIPEGITVPVRTPLLTYKNTCPKCGWLVGYMESLLFELWYPITVSTMCNHWKKIIYEYLVKTGTPENIDFMISNFAVRGCSSPETVKFGSAAHLLQFKSTDALQAIPFIRKYYGDKTPNYMPGYSVVATEHSVMTHRGKDKEFEIVDELFKNNPSGILAMVIDSYNTFNFVERIGNDYQMQVIKRNGVTVLRPDSGDPIPTMMKINWILGEKFGWTINEKGYRIFGNEANGSLGKIKTLQGDKNDGDAIYNMCRAYESAKWSLDNLATFGIGGAMLAAPTRDTQKMAIKLSSITDKDGKWRSVFKDPITDPGKGSKAGRFAVVEENGRIVTKILEQGQPVPEGNLLRPIYRNGAMLVHDDFETVRTRANEWMKTV